MSITGFESAISNNVKSYGDNLALLRDNQLMARNNALSSLQGEFEKYGEIAKIGLELPVAIEGVKGVAGRAKDLYKFIARGGVQDAVGAAKQSVEGAVGDIRDTMAGRLDNLRVSSSFGGGESKVDFNPMLRERVDMSREFTRPGIEMTETDDPNYFETRAGGNSFAYGDSVGEESKVASGLDEYGLPRRTGGNPLFDRGEEPRFSTSRGLDASWENGRVEPSVASMGKQPRGVANPESQLEQYSRPEASPEGRDLEMRSYSAKAEGEIRPGSAIERTTENTFGGDIAEDTSAAAAQSAVEEGSNAVGDALEAGAAAAGEAAAGAAEEGVGAGLLASGIFAPLGALLEGVGAVTELGAVGTGVYGAVQSITDADKEEALRNTPLPAIRQPTLDLGGRVAAPILA